MAIKKKKNKAKTQLKPLNFWGLISATWREVSTFWRPIAGVTVVYGLLYFVLVMGLSISYSYNDISQTVSETLGESSGAFARNIVSITTLFSGSSNSQSDATVLVQFLLFIIATMAMIWVLRRLQSLKHIKIREAYYEGSSRIVPFILVFTLLLVTFVPSAIGSVIFSAAQSAGAVGIELVVAGLISGALLLLTLYWFVVWLPALYIVSLPNGTPIAAIKASSKLTKKRRFWMLRQLIALAAVLVLGIFTVMLPIVMVVPAVAVAAAFIVAFTAFAVAQTFIYTMYRSLLDE